MDPVDDVAAVEGRDSEGVENEQRGGITPSPAPLIPQGFAPPIEAELTI